MVLDALYCTGGHFCPLFLLLKRWFSNHSEHSKFILFFFLPPIFSLYVSPSFPSALFLSAALSLSLSQKLALPQRMLLWKGLCLPLLYTWQEGFFIIYFLIFFFLFNKEPVRLSEASLSGRVSRRCLKSLRTWHQEVKNRGPDLGKSFSTLSSTVGTSKAESKA